MKAGEKIKSWIAEAKKIWKGLTEGETIYVGGTPPPAIASGPVATPAPTPYPYADVERKMRAGLTAYGGSQVPALQHVPQFMEATRRYQFFRDNPYLLPQASILETSGGQNITRPNNLLNWGINVRGNNAIFAQMTPAQVLERAISGLGERMQNYSKFRTGKPLGEQEIYDFGRTYEPGNPDYGKNLWEGLRFFEAQ